MQVQGMSNTSGSSTTTDSTKATSASAAALSSDFMNLLITELQNQDPLQPMDNTEVVAQLTQLSSLSSLQHLEKLSEQGQIAGQLAQAAALIGRTVSGKSGDEIVTGKVMGAAVGTDSQVYLAVGDAAVALTDVLQVAE